MGQYYYPVILKKNRTKSENPVKKAICAHDFGNGLKLMEHSYIHNDVVRAVEYLLAQDKEGVPFVWAGDYAEDFDEQRDNLYSLASDEIINKTLEGIPTQIEHDRWGGDFHALADAVVKDYKFVINHTKKQFVRIPEYVKGEFRIHPLPLLTAESNGLGGGDYRGDSCIDLVGSWKYDTISVGDEVPSGFEELEVHFEE